MAEVMERKPLMMPTIVRREHEGGVDLLTRTVRDTPLGGVEALCIFWSVEHARRVMYAYGYYPEDGWAALEREEDELAAILGYLDEVMEGNILVYIEPAPGASELAAVVRPEELLEMLRNCGRA